jgi:hypothetical protein
VLENAARDLTFTLNPSDANARINLVLEAGNAGFLRTAQPLDLSSGTAIATFSSAGIGISSDLTNRYRVEGQGSLAGSCAMELVVPVLKPAIRTFTATVVGNPSILEFNPLTNAPTQFSLQVTLAMPPLDTDGIGNGSVTIHLNPYAFTAAGSGGVPVDVEIVGPNTTATFQLTPGDNTSRDLMATRPLEVQVYAGTDPVWNALGLQGTNVDIPVLDDERRSFFTSPVDGAFGAAPAMDTLCDNHPGRPMNGNAFKALVADGVTRCRPGGVCSDWVLAPGRQYLWSAGNAMGRANSNAVIPTLAIPAGQATILDFWTGLDTGTWQHATALCLGPTPWASAQAGDNGTYGRVAPGLATIQDGSSPCNQLKAILCVEQ